MVFGTAVVTTVVLLGLDLVPCVFVVPASELRSAVVAWSKAGCIFGDRRRYAAFGVNGIVSAEAAYWVHD